MTYNDVEVLVAVLEGLGHRTSVERVAGQGWRILLACGCTTDDAKEGRCPG